LSREANHVSQTSFLAGTLLLFTVLTAVMTYPQIFRIRDAVNDAGDPLLNAWALCWVAHQLPFSPPHLFDGNIFYPERHALAFSETLVVPALSVAPLLWSGAGHILAYNLVFLSGFVLSGFGAALLVRELTRNTGAAILAGIVFAFLPYRMDHYAHLQLQQAEWIPLALWAFHRVLANGRFRDGLWLGVFVACQALSCVYYGVFLAAFLVVVGGTLLLSNLTIARARLPVLAAGVVLALVLLVPMARAYGAARRTVGERSSAEAVVGSATWRNFLATPDNNVWYGQWSSRFADPERRLFPGMVAIALAIVALWPPWSWTRLAYALGLLFAIDVTRGFNGLTYQYLYDYVTPFRALRIPARMGVMAGFSLAVLAGFGTARLAAAIRRPPLRLAFVMTLCIAALLEYRSFPLSLTTIPRSPPDIYADLLYDRGDSPTTAIIEIPIARQDPTYMYYSTFHWQSLLNGYSGFLPPSYIRLVQSMEDFPDARSLLMLHSRGARYALIHGELLGPDEYQRLIHRVDTCQCELKLVSRRPWQGSEISLYRVY
jgi:hypothetical protein